MESGRFGLLYICRVFDFRLYLFKGLLLGEYSLLFGEYTNKGSLPKRKTAEPHPTTPRPPSSAAVYILNYRSCVIFGEFGFFFLSGVTDLVIVLGEI